MKIKTLNEAFRAADKSGEVVLECEGKRYTVKAQQMPPFDASKFKPVPMPGLTGEDLDNIIREGRERGYQ